MFESLINTLKEILNTKEESQNPIPVIEPIDLNNGDTINEVIVIINGIEIFEVTPVNGEQYLEFLKTLEDIYIKITAFVLSGCFRSFDNSKYKEITFIIQEKINAFESHNVSSDRLKPFDKILTSLAGLSDSFSFIHGLNQRFDFKREEILYTDKIFRNNKDDEEYIKIFDALIFAFFAEIITVNNHTDNLLGNLLLKLKELDKYSYDDDRLNILKKLIQDKIKLCLFKISLITGKRSVPISLDRNILYSRIKELEGSIFSGIKKDIQFLYHPNNGQGIDISFHEKKVFENKEFNTLSLRIVTDYYREVLKSVDKIDNLFNFYKKHTDYKFSKENYSNYVNYIYIGNNLLSLLVEEHQKTKGSANTRIKNKIEGLYKELIVNNKSKKKTIYKNYFTYFKYSLFKRFEFKDYLNLKKFKLAKQSLWSAENSFDIGKKIYESDNNNEYYEYCDEDNFIRPSAEETSTINLNQIYCFSLYVSPFSFNRNNTRMKNLEDDLFKGKLELVYDEKFNDVSNKIDNYKNEAMTIIGIFTGIVVYSFGTIQLFSIIEDLGSAVMFAGIFLSGILFIISAIFYDSNVAFWRDKGVKIFIAGLAVVVVSIVGKYIMSSTLINTNKGNNIYNELDIKIQQAEILNERLEEGINSYKELREENKAIENSSIKK